MLQLEETEVVITRNGHRVEVRIETPDSFFERNNGWVSSDFALEVPAGLMLVAETTNGDIHIDGAYAACDAETGYGSVYVAGVQGDTRARSQSGKIVVRT
jgi:hypothetical protein